MNGQIFPNKICHLVVATPHAPHRTPSESMALAQVRQELRVDDDLMLQQRVVLHELARRRDAPQDVKVADLLSVRVAGEDEAPSTRRRAPSPRDRVCMLHTRA